MAQGYFIPHDFIFHRIFEGCIEQHFHGLSLHESHFDDSFAESSVSHHFDDDPFLSCFEF